MEEFYTMIEFKKLINKKEYAYTFGSNTIVYDIVGYNTYIKKDGNKLQLDRSKPFIVNFGRDYERFKTLKEAMEFAFDKCRNEYNFKQKELAV